MDDFILYDKALSSSEITSMYNSGNGKAVIPDSNTKLLYHFDENGDDPRNTGKIMDSSGNGNNVTLSGAQYGDGIVPSSIYSSHSGVTLEEGTTNLVPNPSFESDITTSWNGKNSINFTTSQTDSDGNQLVGSNNIKDVFYYDTTKDSDSGAWRNNANAQSKSWYTEAFSTTRGKKREFPEKAYIVAEDSYFDIIDAVENKLWMRLASTTSGDSSDYWRAGRNISSVYALNGGIYFGLKDFSNATYGLRKINYVLDSLDRNILNASGWKRSSRNISERNIVGGATYTQVSAISIINDSVNDVSVVVIAGKTYVAVATDGGVSVINETDGTVVNVESGLYVSVLAITSVGRLYTAIGGTRLSANQLYIYNSLPTTNGQSADTAYGWGSTPAIATSSANNFNQIYVTQGTSTIDGTSNTVYLGTAYYGLTVLQEKLGDTSHGSVKYYTKDKITEEMIGEIKGQWGFWETTTTEANQFKASGYLDTGKMNQSVSMYGNASGTQGSTLTVNRGAQISGKNYEHLNLYQGTISFWVKPSWAGNDNLNHTFFSTKTNSPSEPFTLYKDSANFIRVTGNYYWAPINVSGWAANTWHHIVLRWSSNSQFDSGTYITITADNSTAVAGVGGGPEILSIPTSVPPMYIGSYYDGTQPSQSLIDDFAIFDRVLTTTEISSLYNSGNGNEAGSMADSSLKFYAKMDGSGTLQPVTYNGGGSASKMTSTSSELTGGTNVLSNGNFELSTGGVATGWTIDAGATGTDAETANILYDTRSQKVSTTANARGIYRSAPVTQNTNYTLNGWIKSDGTNVVAIGIYDNTNNSFIVVGDKSTATTSSSWVPISYSFKTPAGCTSINVLIRPNSNSTFNYYIDNISISPNLFDNGGLEGTYVAGVAPGLSALGAPTFSDETTIVHTGSHSQKVVAVTGNGSQGIIQGMTGIVGNSYILSGWIYISPGSASIRIQNNGGINFPQTTISTTGSWQHFSVVATATNTLLWPIIYSVNSASTFYVDDLSLTPLDNVALSLKSFAPISDSSAIGSSLSVQGSGTGVQSLASGVRNSALTFDGSTGYLRQQTIATNVGTLSYSMGNDTTTATFSDDGMDFNTYATAAGNAGYMIVITNSDNTTSWGYLGTASGTGNKDIQIYTTKARTTRGWGATGSTLPIAGSKMPVGYEIRKTDFQITGSLTIGTWVNFNTNAINRGIIRKGNGGNTVYAFQTNSSGQISFVTTGGCPLTSNASLSSGSWFYVVAVYLSVTNVSIYINGVLDKNGAVACGSGLADSVLPFQIGMGPDYFMNGSIDEPFVTADVLSASQILDMYNKGLGALNHATKTDQKLAGTTNTVQSVWGSSDGTTIYAGTDTALSIIKNGKVGNYTDSDSVITSLTTSTTPALLSNNTVSMDIVGSSLTTPTMIVGSSASGVTVLNSDRLTKTRNTSLPGYKYGSASLKLDNSLSFLDSVYSTPLTLTASSYTISAYAFSDGTALTSSDISLYANSMPLVTTYTDSGGGWTRLSGTFTGVASALNFGLQVRPGKIIYVDGVQVENKANVTTYTDGSLGSGYSWSGTANNSSSSRTYSSISYPWTASNTGSVSLWFKPIGWGGNACLPAEGDIIRIGSNKLIYVDPSNCTRINFYEGLQKAYFTINSTNLVAGRWNNLIINFSPTSTQLFLNGVPGGTSSGVTSSDSGTSIVLALAPNVYKPNSIYSDLRVFNQPLLANEASDIYLSGLVNHQVDSSTIAKYATSGIWESPVMNFDSNAQWGSVPNFIPTETLNGNSINYEVRSSSDGVSWNSYTANTGSTPNYSIASVANKYVQVKATLNSSDQTTTPTLSAIGINYVKDTTPPITNATNTIMSRSLGANQILPSTWTNNIAPAFNWDQGVDNSGGSGLRGYCLSLSQQIDVDPINSKGNLLGTSPVTLGGSNCQFIIGTNSIDFGEVAYRGSSWLTTSNNPYYLRIRAVDNTGNVFNSETYAEFVFYFDEISPTNVTSISAPSNSFANVNDIYFNWPTIGASMAIDNNSNILGYQYSINNENNWLGTDTDTLLGIQYLPLSTVVPYYLTSSRDGLYIQTGNNTIYFRSIDNAGNTSTINRTANVSYGGDAPTFPDGSKVTISPQTSSTNSYAISWPNGVVNSPRTIKSYYYMVNVTPPSNLATITSNSLIYIPTTSTSIPTGMINGLVKGSNTIYVVSIDDLDNYSQSNFISGTVTLNSNLPDPIVNLSVSDSSIKAAKVWRASLAWEVPEYKGTGDLTYKIQRSEDNISWTNVSETTGLSYVDTVSSSKKYYWRIGTTDSTDLSKANPTYSFTVSILPKGSYLSAADITSGPTLEKTTTKRATIGWTTNRPSDSKIVFGVESGKYFTEEISNSTQVSDHTINLINLLPSTTYYYKVKYTDEDGNTGQSEERTFVTDSAPQVKNVVLRYVSIDSAQINFTSLKAEKVKIYYGKSTSFGGVKELATSLRETSYTIGLDSLEDGTKYYYRVNPIDSEGIEYEGTILDLTTLPKPSVSNIKIQQVKNTVDTTIVVSWLSNTDISSIISYYPESNSNQVIDKVNLTLTKDEHKLSLTGLLPEKAYILVVKGRDKIGNEAVSEKIKFTTATDTRSPIISEMIVETVPNGTNATSDKKSQVVISWNTDEPSTSEVQYGEGYSEIYPMKSITDYNLTYNHMVSISGLEPSKVYHFKAVSKDKAGNIGNSSNMVSITLKANSNSTDLILGSLRNLFNF